MYIKKLIRICSFLLVLSLLGNYVVLSSAEENDSNVTEQVSSGDLQISSGDANNASEDADGSTVDLSGYEYREEIEEGTTFEVIFGAAGMYVHSTLSEDYINTMKDCSLKTKLLEKGTKYIDKNSKKYRQCVLLLLYNDKEIADVFLLNSYTTFQKQQNVTNNTFALPNNTMRLEFRLCDNIDWKLNSIEVVDSEYSGFDGEIRSNGLVDSVNRKATFTYEQTKSDCWFEIDQYSITQQPQTQQPIIVVIDIPTVPQSTSVAATTTEVAKDRTKPTVKGVKNKKVYKKAVTIKFSDKQSGIKKATLNGKKIKIGKKVKKNGKYTLRVYDKAGNCTTVKFRIKIKKKKK